MSEPTIEEQLAIVTNSRNALLQSTEQLYKDNQKAITDHAKALQAVQSDLATKTSQLEAVTQAKTALDLRVATLTNEKQTLEAAVALANQLNETLTQKTAELEQYRPYDPRILAGKAFYGRVSKEDMVTLLTSEIPQLVTVGKTIVAYAENDWPVILDSTDFQNLVGYVLQSGVFDEAEVFEIMRDSTLEEAYKVPE